MWEDMTRNRATPPARIRQAAERRGRRAELIAEFLLRLKGYGVLARRFRTPMGEIDLIARRGNKIAFIEVKRRSTADEAAFSITGSGQERIARAAALWLGRHQEARNCELRFDAILVSPWRMPRHLQGAFEASLS